MIGLISHDTRSADDGHEIYCRWCGDGGTLAMCDKCERSFCHKCIVRTVGRLALTRRGGRDALRALSSWRWPSRRLAFVAARASGRWAAFLVRGALQRWLQVTVGQLLHHRLQLFFLSLFVLLFQHIQTFF